MNPLIEILKDIGSIKIFTFLENSLKEKTKIDYIKVNGKNIENKESFIDENFKPERIKRAKKIVKQNLVFKIFLLTIMLVVIIVVL